MVTTFQAWIRTQTERDDPVGRLARDIDTDTEVPEGLWKANWLDHMSRRNAGPGAMAAFENAWEEYAVSLLDKYR